MTAYATSQSTGSNYALASAAAFAPTAFSVMAWIRFSAVSASNRVFASRGQTDGNNRQFRLEVDTSENALFRVSLDGTTWLTASNVATTLSVDTWYLVIGVHDGTNAYCYVGDAGGSALTSGSVSASGSLHSHSNGMCIGADNQGGGNHFENGLIDLVALWDSKALSSAERTYVYGALGSAGDGVNLDYLQNDPDANNPGEPEHYFKLDEDGGPYSDSVGLWDLTVTGTINRTTGHVDEADLFPSSKSSEIIIREMLR